jgi:lipoprotein-anchoring transpeptidase ErfK/SrfK
MPWLSTVLAGLLAVTTPVVAQLAGERTASPAAPILAVAAPAAAGHPRLERPRPPRTTVLGEHASSTPAGASQAEPADRNAAKDSKPSERSKPAKPTLQRASAPAVPKVAQGVHLLINAVSGLVAHRNPWSSAPAVGTVATVSRYYHVPLVLWVEATNAQGTWGRIELPYVYPRRDGWIPLEGLARDQTAVTVTVDLSEREVRVWKNGELRYHVAGAIGAPSTPTPPGEYVVTDRVPFAAPSSYGSFAFGISGIQPHLPPGWSGGDQLAIHGTNQPSSIGAAASAGCIRISAWAIDRFKPLLRLGTPVIVQR